MASSRLGISSIAMLGAIAEGLSDTEKRIW
jgi:hypothetical protein